MPWNYPQDQQRLVQLYDLGREDLTDSSSLRWIMDDAQSFDDQFLTTTVADVQALLGQIFDPGGLLEQSQQAADNPARSLTRGSEYSIDYGASGGVAWARANQISAIRGQITRLLESGRPYSRGGYGYGNHGSAGGYLSKAQATRATRM